MQVAEFLDRDGDNDFHPYPRVQRPVKRLVTIICGFISPPRHVAARIWQITPSDTGKTYIHKIMLQNAITQITLVSVDWLERLWFDFGEWVDLKVGTQEVKGSHNFGNIIIKHKPHALHGKQLS